MKITQADLATLRECITPLDTLGRRRIYLAGEFTHAEKVKDLDKRYRWDLLWASKAAIGPFINHLYTYCDDDHIDTALRLLVPILEK